MSNTRQLNNLAIEQEKLDSLTKQYQKLSEALITKLEQFTSADDKEAIRQIREIDKLVNEKKYKNLGYNITQLSYQLTKINDNNILISLKDEISQLKKIPSNEFDLSAKNIENISKERAQFIEDKKKLEISDLTSLLKLKDKINEINASARGIETTVNAWDEKKEKGIRISPTKAASELNNAITGAKWDVSDQVKALGNNTINELSLIENAIQTSQSKLQIELINLNKLQQEYDNFYQQIQNFNNDISSSLATYNTSKLLQTDNEVKSKIEKNETTGSTDIKTKFNLLRLEIDSAKDKIERINQEIKTNMKLANDSLDKVSHATQQTRDINNIFNQIILIKNIIKDKNKYGNADYKTKLKSLEIDLNNSNYANQQIYYRGQPTTLRDEYDKVIKFIQSLEKSQNLSNTSSQPQPQSFQASTTGSQPQPQSYQASTTGSQPQPHHTSSSSVASTSSSQPQSSHATILKSTAPPNKTLDDLVAEIKAERKAEREKARKWMTSAEPKQQAQQQKQPQQGEKSLTIGGERKKA